MTAEINDDETDITIQKTKYEQELEFHKKAALHYMYPSDVAETNVIDEIEYEIGHIMDKDLIKKFRKAARD